MDIIYKMGHAIFVLERWLAASSVLQELFVLIVRLVTISVQELAIFVVPP